MKQITRRQCLRTLGLGAVAAMSPAIIRAQSLQPRVVVVGGGFAGATTAKYLRHWSSGVDVTLVEANSTYYSPILSNLVLNGQRSLSQLAFSYSTLQQSYGINVVQQTVAGVDPLTQRLQLGDGSQLSYDRLVLAPGIRFRSVPGLDSSRILHAWKSGDQVVQLQQQLAAMPAGGHFVLAIPPKPYRCPPGPYERACVVADYLQRNKPGSRVTVLDANPSIVAERETFSVAFEQTYAGIVDYLPNAELLSVDSDQKIAYTSLGSFTADVLNVIPTQEAGSLIHETGLANDPTGRWASVNPLSYEATATQNIHVVGDSQGTGQPKAGHIGNAEAKVCADAILRLLSGMSPYGTPLTNSACYSPISANTASWLTIVYRYDATTGTMQPVPESLGQSTTPTTLNYTRMFQWAENLFADTFS